MIPIVCGDPNDGHAASYTLFVLPFAYHLEPYEEGIPYRVYTPSAEADRWRRHYLTVETAAVLFKRAKSFELDREKCAQVFRIKRDDRTIPVRVSAPRILLFEWPVATTAAEPRTMHDPLHLGFLIIETFFPEPKIPVSLDDFLAFNELFRYWQQPYETHERDYQAFLEECPIGMGPIWRTVRDANVPDMYFDRWASLLCWPVQHEDGTLSSLFPREWQLQAKDWIHGSEEVWQSGWIAYADPRTFVWTCAILEEGGKTLRAHLPEADHHQDLWQFGHWIKLLNVDMPDHDSMETHQSTPFERQWAEQRTYQRWAHRGTLYGFNYHSGALLGPVKGPPLWRHFGSIYFDQVMLLLYLRIVSFSFSRQLSQISAQARDDSLRQKSGRGTWQRAFRDLRWDFALFTNLYEFPLFSNQQQGLEIYELARTHMDVAELFKEIQEEIRSSHEHLVMEVGQEQTEMSTRLTVVATLGLLFGLITGALGMNVLVSKFVNSDDVSFSKDWQIVIIVSCIFLIVMGFSIVKSRTIANIFDHLACFFSSSQSNRRS